MDKRVAIIAILLIGGLCLLGVYDNSSAQEIPPEIEYTSYDLRDPFKSPLEEEITMVPEDIFLPEEFVVRGMVWGIEPVRAIINDEVVGKGDTILDVQVLEIKKEGVYLLYKGKKFIVKPQ